MKKLILWIVVLLLSISMIASFSFAGCKAEEATVEEEVAGEEEVAEEEEVTPQEVIEITLWYLAANNELYETVVADFNAANPGINVSIVPNSTDDHKRNLKIAASSKTLPDIWVNWGGSLGSFYPENDLSYNLSDYAKANGWDQKFFESALDLATYDGNLSGYPTSINMMGMFYCKDVFEKCGLEVPTTFEEFENVLAKLKENGYAPMAFSGKNGWHVMRLVEALIEMYSGSEEHDMISTLNSSWNTDGVVKAFTKFKEYADKGYFLDGFITLDPDNARALLYAEEAIIDCEGPWFERLLGPDEQDHDLYGYFKLPLDPAKGNRMSSFIAMVQFNKNLSDDKLAAAMKLLDFMYSPESVVKYSPLIGQPIPRLDDKISDELTMVKSMVDDFNKYGGFTITDQALPQEVVSKLFEAQDSVATGQMTPERAAEFMQEEVEAYLTSE